MKQIWTVFRNAFDVLLQVKSWKSAEVQVRKKKRKKLVLKDTNLKL